MFFLLRLAFWLGLVLVLLPRDRTPESAKLPQLGASEAVSAASAAVSDMSQFCKRQPAACEVGGQAATILTHRAQDGARKLYQIITDKRSSDRTGSIGEVADAAPAQIASRDTPDAGRSAGGDGAPRRRRDGKSSPEPVVHFQQAISLSIAGDPIYGFGIEHGTR